MLLLRSLIKKVIKLNNSLLFFVTLSLVLVSTIIIHYIEPETFPTVFEALWWVMTTITTVGYGDVSPVTVEGKSFAMILYIFGIGLLGVVIGRVVDSLSTFKRMKEEGKLKYNGSNHIVIFGWSKKSEYATKEILESEADVEIVIIDQLKKEPISHERISYIQGDPSLEETLDMANIREAMAAIIFADDSVHDSVLGDGKTLLFVSAVEHYAPNVYTVVEILKQEHIKNFKHVKVDEFVLSHEMISRLLVRSTFQKGITNIFSQLLSRSLGEDIYEISKKPHWQTYRDAVEELMDVGATLLGEGNKLNVNARLDEVIKEDATLRVICSKETFSKIKS